MSDYIGSVPLPRGTRFHPGDDPPTLDPVPIRRWLADRPCWTCGKHVQIAEYFRVSPMHDSSTPDGWAFCGASCSLAWHESQR